MLFNESFAFKQLKHLTAVYLLGPATPPIVARMSTPPPHTNTEHEKASAPDQPLDLNALSHASGVPTQVLTTFAKISDLRNRHLFTAEAARKAFGGVKV